MRTLAMHELDEIFAGDGGVAATMPTVTVTSRSFRDSGSPYPYGGSSWAGPSYNEDGGYCYSGAGAFYAIEWRGIPDMNDVRCELDKASPGMGVPNSSSLSYVNDWAFKDRTTGDVVHKPANDPPANSDPLYGQSDSAHNAIYIYAHGLSASNSTSPYIDPDTGIEHPPLQTNMTPFQHALLVTAHESAHGRGIVGEKEAEGYAVKALLRYKANLNQCP